MINSNYRVPALPSTNFSGDHFILTHYNRKEKLAQKEKKSKEGLIAKITECKKKDSPRPFHFMIYTPNGQVLMQVKNWCPHVVSDALEDHGFPRLRESPKRLEESAALRS
jgi:PHP family Zn ribbon phosphoesterase